MTDHILRKEKDQGPKEDNMSKVKLIKEKRRGGGGIRNYISSEPS